jgi:N-acylneuraminate cytidylyltransferase
MRIKKKDIKVAIPLKTNSRRIPNKNLRPFVYGKSLFDIKIAQLLKIFNPNDIYVSSENSKVKKLTDKYGLNFILRDIALTKATVKEPDIVKSVVDKMPSYADIMWCQVTCPHFEDFEEIVDIWNKLDSSYDSLAVVRECKKYLLDEKGNPINYQFGYWHKISQDLTKIYEVLWAAFIMKRELLNKTYYQIGRKPYLYKFNKICIDINNISDFKLAQKLYEL